MLRKRNAPGVAFLHTQNANKDSELSVGPMSLDFSQWQDENLFYMPIELPKIPKIRHFEAPKNTITKIQKDIFFHQIFISNLFLHHQMPRLSK